METQAHRKVETVERTKQNQYFVASEHAPAAAPGRAVARGQRRDSVGPHIGLFLFGPSERNKIKILLRWRPSKEIVGRLCRQLSKMSLVHLRWVNKIMVLFRLGCCPPSSAIAKPSYTISPGLSTGNRPIPCACRVLPGGGGSCSPAAYQPGHISK